MTAAVGAVLAASLLRASGSAMQKWSVASESRGALSRLVRSAVWLGGLACLFAGFLFFVRALGVGEAGVVTALGNLTLIFAALIGTLLLGESLSRREWGGIGILTLATACLGLVSPTAGPGAALSSTTTTQWFAASAVVATCALLAVAFASPRPRRAEVANSLASGIQIGAANVAMRAWLLRTGVDASDVQALRMEARAGLGDFAFVAAFLHLTLALIVLQVAYRRGRVGAITSLGAIGATLCSLFGGYLAVGEALSVPQLAAIAGVLASLWFLRGEHDPHARASGLGVEEGRGAIAAE